MSNFLFGGYEYTNDLQASFRLQNLIQTQANETQEMLLSLFNKSGDGYNLVTKTLHDAEPKFCLDKRLNNVTTNIFTYDGTTSNIDMLSNIDLQGVYKITGGITPTSDSDYATKGYVDLVEGVTSVGITTATDALTITNTPITSTGDINIDVSANLQNLSDLSTTGFVQRGDNNTYTTFSPGLDGQVIIASSGNFTWSTLAMVTSIGITTNTSGLTITNTPITSTGDINVNLSTQLQNLSDLGTLGLVNRTATDTFATIANGTNGQFLTIDSNDNIVWGDPVTSVTLATNTNGLTISNPTITSTGTITADLSSQLQNLSDLGTLGLVNRTATDTFATIANGTNGQFLTIDSNDNIVWGDLDATLTSLASLSTDGVLYKNSSSIASLAIPSANGQIIQSNSSAAGGIEWITPASGGNVSGSGTSSVNALPKFTNTTSTEIQASDVMVEFNTDLNIPGVLKADTFKTTDDESIMFLDSDGFWRFDKALFLPAGSSISRTYSNYGYLNIAGQIGTASGTNDYNIRCQRRIVAQQFNTVSSRTVKNVIAQNSPVEQESLNWFNKITATKYTYKDVMQEGNYEYFGVIAEDLKEVMPQCVNDLSQYVPNIYQKSQITEIDNNLYTINIKLLDNIKLSIDQTIEMHADNGSFVGVIKEINDNSDITTLIIQTNKDIQGVLGDSNEIFVYGTYEYSPTIAYDKLWGVLFCATKAMLNKLNFLENTIQTLKN